MADLEKTKSFEERMQERIKDSIGELMSDADLKKIVDRGVEAAFFQERSQVDTYGHKRASKPPLIEEILQTLLKESVEKVVNQWVKDNSDKVEKMLDDLIQNGVGMAVINTMKFQFDHSLLNFQNSVLQDLQRM